MAYGVRGENAFPRAFDPMERGKRVHLPPPLPPQSQQKFYVCGLTWILSGRKVLAWLAPTLAIKTEPARKGGYPGRERKAQSSRSIVGKKNVLVMTGETREVSRCIKWMAGWSVRCRPLQASSVMTYSHVPRGIPTSGRIRSCDFHLLFPCAKRA